MSYKRDMKEEKVKRVFLVSLILGLTLLFPDFLLALESKKLSPKPIISIKSAQPVVAVSSEPKELKLVVGESKIIPVRGLVRSAVGDPNIIGVLAISSHELLINGKAGGTTSLTIWGDEGRVTYQVIVTKEPLATKILVIPLKNIRLQTLSYKDGVITKSLDKEMIANLEKMLSMFLGKDRFNINSELNNIVVQGTEKDIKNTQELILNLDKPLPQIMIEAKIIEFSESDIKALGLNWTLQKNKIFTSTLSTKATPQELRTYNKLEGATITFDSLGSYSEQYLATLSALERAGKTKILANPKMVAQDGKIASLIVGDRVPIITTTYDEQGNRSQSASYIPVGIVLNITPKIGDDGYITTFIVPEVSIVSEWKGDYPVISTRQTSSEIRVKDGESIVIGGLLSSKEIEILSQVPLLGEIPILGSLFRNKEKSKVKAEIVIILTPHILKAEGVIDKD